MLITVWGSGQENVHERGAFKWLSPEAGGGLRVENGGNSNSQL
jgi:hypothetical protein